MSKLNQVFFAGCLCASSVLLYAVDADPDPVIVPLHDASKPPIIHVHMMQGGIKMRGEDRKDVAVESHSRTRETRAPRSDGMRRLDVGAGGLDIVEENNVVTVKSGFNESGDIVILVPRRASVELKSMNGGEIDVENVDGEIEVENLNGAIHLKDVGGSVVAHSMNGAVVASLKNINPSKPMSFSTMNGKIDVTLPEDLKANVSMKTDNGEILSDFDVKLDSPVKSVSENNGRQPDGTFHVRLDKTLHGTINGGGPEYKFRSFNGQIFIRKGK